jgi:hypothetical protein
MTKKSDLRAELDADGIVYPSRATTAELEDLRDQTAASAVIRDATVPNVTVSTLPNPAELTLIVAQAVEDLASAGTRQTQDVRARLAEAIS